MSQTYIFLQSVISLAFLAIFLFWFYRDYKVDSFRQDLFKLRDQLFDDAMKEGLDFDHPSYAVLRSAINGFIRYAHRINIFQVIALVAISDRKTKSRENSFNTRFEKNIGSLTEDQRKMLKKHKNAMNIVMLKHVLTASPLSLIFIFVPLGYVVKTHQVAAKFLKKYRPQINTLDSAALAHGEERYSSIIWH